MKISENKTWTMEEVRVMCIHRDYYTRGTNEDYSKMLWFVHDNKPTTKNIYKVAKNIFDHSDIDLDKYGCSEDDMIAAIMFDISRECVDTHYGIER